MIIVKETKNNGVLTFKEIDRNVAKDIIVNNHYSKKWNTSFGVVNIGVYKNDILLGVAVFGNLMNPNSYKSISDDFVDGKSIIELNRLWLDDELGHNAETTMLGACFKIIKKTRPYIKAIQSFADGRLGCGTIYKASNFDYYGFESTLFAEDILTGEIYHHVSFENTKRPKGQMERWRLLLDNQLKWFEVKTYRYIYWLDRKIKCKKKRLPYPEYDIGQTDVIHEYAGRMYCRMYIVFLISLDDVYSEKCKNKAIEMIGFDEFTKQVKELEDTDAIKLLKSKNYSNSHDLSSLFGD